MLLKQFIKRIPLIGDFTKTIYRKISPNKDFPDYWINKYLKNIELDVVQIGSNDGNSGDPIYKLVRKNTKWKVVFVEPVPYLFERLKNNYPHESRFIFENVAINDGSMQIFYSVNEDAKNHIEDLPFWYDQLGSFNRKNITNHLDGILEPYILETEVKGVSLNELFRRNNIDKLQLLHIDTEGYDFKVLSQLDLARFQPTLILFEHKHLNETEKKQAVIFLRDHYHLFEFSGDYLCILQTKIEQKDFHVLKKVHVSG